MTILEVLLTTSLWIITGVWISYKRHWYDNCQDDESTIRVIVTIILSPVFLVLNLIAVFLIDPWDQ